MYVDLEKLNRRPRGKGRGKNSYKQRGREANHKRLLNTENKLRVDGEWEGGESGWWVLRRAPVGMSTGCCMETNLTINFILKKNISSNMIMTQRFSFFM